MGGLRETESTRQQLFKVEDMEAAEFPLLGGRGWVLMYSTNCIDKSKTQRYILAKEINLGVINRPFLFLVFSDSLKRILQNLTCKKRIVFAWFTKFLHC